MTTVEKVAYLRGLLEGLNLNSEKSETKMFNAIMDVLEELAEGQDDLESSLGLISAQLDEVDEDLGMVEELLYGGCECDDEECDCGCEDEGHNHVCDCAPPQAEAYEPEEAEYYEVECPACREVICVDEGILEEGSVECPNCGEKLEFEIEFEN